MMAGEAAIASGRAVATEGVEAFAAFDCETTGLDPQRDELLQLAAVVFTPDGTREWVTLVNPGRPVDLQITRLTGITPDQLRDAPPPGQALRAFRAFVGDLPLVAHNAAFDTGFVETGLQRHRLPPLSAPVYDTLELARLVAPAAPSHRLEELAHARGLTLDRAHDALADARAAGELFAALVREVRAMEPRLLRTVAHFLARARGPLARLIVGLAGGSGLPTLVRQTLAPIGGDDRPAPSGPPPDLASLLAPGSPLAERLDTFEVRPGQARMLEAVARAFANDRHLIVEAGTGTGKSLAYLLPALAWATGQRERVVVATHTVNLQEQLVEKDLPTVTGAGVLAGRVALLKGRGQYACLKLWEERLQVEVAPEDAAFHARFASWLAQTETGDRSELGLYGEDEERFGGLSTDAVACTGRRCPFHDGCFLFRARRHAERADVVVANYALLFADLATGGQVLPEYAYLVCDEAHHLEDQASSHLGRVVGERAVERFWRLLERSGGGGLLPALRAQFDPLGLIAGNAGRRAGDASRRIAHALSALRTAREGAEAYFDGLRAWAAGRGGSGAYGRSTLRFEPRPAQGRDPVWDAVVVAGERLATGLSDLAGALEAVAAVLDDASPEAEADAERIVEVRQLSGRAAELAGDIGLALEGREGWVTWCEIAQARSGVAGAAVVRACPIDPGDILRRDVFAAKRAVVMTSATLSVRGRFDYLRGRLGLEEGEERERTDELLVDSPFDFPSQALLGIPTDAPRPLPGDPIGYARAVAPLLIRLLLQSRGHALVLFTSNRVMREVRDHCKPELEAAGIACLAQGLDGSRGALTSALRRNEETVVLGSASFWEGVDVQGDALRCLVIAQLPFWPPDMPLQQARQEAIAARGGSPFRELQLPQAVLRFKQGFGRLIRSTSDRGVAVVLDARLVTSDYGRSFLTSLPKPATVIGPSEKVLARTAGWLGASGPTAGE